MHPHEQSASQPSSFNKRRNVGGGKRYGRAFRQSAWVANCEDAEI